MIGSKRTRQLELELELGATKAEIDENNEEENNQGKGRLRKQRKSRKINKIKKDQQGGGEESQQLGLGELGGQLNEGQEIDAEEEEEDFEYTEAEIRKELAVQMNRLNVIQHREELSPYLDARKCYSSVVKTAIDSSFKTPSKEVQEDNEKEEVQEDGDDDEEDEEDEEEVVVDVKDAEDGVEEKEEDAEEEQQTQPQKLPNTQNQGYGQKKEESQLKEDQPQSKQSIFQCNYKGCGELIRGELAYRLHVLLHQGEVCYECRIRDCDAYFLKKPELEEHVKYVHMQFDKHVLFTCFGLGLPPTKCTKK
ncbi:MAG: hypothetical protein EZS28_009000 [Streblomastix strix]|uniref:C2H2-type domain-containing protein n=1 Tax=Streblomastix strix TaxID=222440 RepID=A0A5J4WLN4_9EUKA|nr:MAG: hypothetical protein EZS28_009000 [Streblomastix strix]